jgi:hypothetical protein
LGRAAAATSSGVIAGPTWAITTDRAHRRTIAGRARHHMVCGLTAAATASCLVARPRCRSCAPRSLAGKCCLEGRARICHPVRGATLRRVPPDCRGLNAKELSTYIGHSDIRATYNRYRHLMRGSEALAAKRLTALLEGSAGENMVKVSTGAERSRAFPSGSGSQRLQ